MTTGNCGNKSLVYHSIPFRCVFPVHLPKVLCLVSTFGSGFNQGHLKLSPKARGMEPYLFTFTIILLKNSKIAIYIIGQQQLCCLC